MTQQTAFATPEPDDSAPFPEYAPPASAPVAKRGLGTGGIIAIVFGGVIAATLIFGGGIAVGLAIPTGGASDGPGTSQGTRPGAPGSGTGQERPTAPNSDDTQSGDSAEEG